MKSPDGGKALLIQKPTVNGQVSPFPLAINTMGSWKRMAMSLGANSVDAVAAELGSLMKAKPPTSFREGLKLLGTALELRHMKPKLVKDGVCKEVVHKVDSSEVRVDRWPKAHDWKNPSTINQQPSTLLILHSQKCWPLDGGL